MTFDSSGNLYITDGNACVVRLLSASTGTMSIIAGTGTQSYSGDGGLATAATFNLPCGITLDSSRNIYIVDSYSHVVRKITRSTGIITTIAGLGPSQGGYSGDGGLATSARLFYPRGITLDSSNNIYITDAANGVVRKITASTGIITTVVGNQAIKNTYSGDGGAATSAGMYDPFDIKLDSARNMFIAEYNNNTIRYVNATTGIITTIAGLGPTQAAYSGDGGLATLGKLKEPQGIALNNGNIYFADSGNGVIRKITPGNSWALTGNIMGPTGPTGGVGSAYTPATSGNWTGTAPTTIQGALDRMAAALVSLGRYP